MNGLGVIVTVSAAFVSSQYIVSVRADSVRSVRASA